MKYVLYGTGIKVQNLDKYISSLIRTNEILLEFIRTDDSSESPICIAKIGKPTDLGTILM